MLLSSLGMIFLSVRLQRISGFEHLKQVKDVGKNQRNLWMQGKGWKTFLWSGSSALHFTHSSAVKVIVWAQKTVVRHST